MIPTIEYLRSQCIPVTESGCWLWLGHTSKTTGYGLVSLKGKLESGKVDGAHRVSYELFNGPIPEGFCIDHLCRVRCCINPDHLRVVTPRQNCLENNSSVVAINIKKTHCPRGHELAGDNLLRCKSSRRRCRECANAKRRKNGFSGPQLANIIEVRP
mgnify:CR=1 FL=1